MKHEQIETDKWKNKELNKEINEQINKENIRESQNSNFKNNLKLNEINNNPEFMLNLILMKIFKNSKRQIQ